MSRKPKTEYVLIATLLAGIMIFSGFMAYKMLFEKKILKGGDQPIEVQAEMINPTLVAKAKPTKVVASKNKPNVKSAEEENIFLQFLPDTGIDYQIYTPLKNDDLFSVSKKFAISPETILWNNVQIKNNGIVYVVNCN